MQVRGDRGALREQVTLESARGLGIERDTSGRYLVANARDAVFDVERFLRLPVRL
jgi:hypothetical protein